MAIPFDEYTENYMEVFGHLPDTWRWVGCKAGDWNRSRVGTLSQHMLFDGPDNNRLIMTARRYAR